MPMPWLPVGTRNVVMPPAPSPTPSQVRAATTMTVDTWASGTNSFVPFRI